MVEVSSRLIEAKKRLYELTNAALVSPVEPGHMWRVRAYRYAISHEGVNAPAQFSVRKLRMQSPDFLVLRSLYESIFLDLYRERIHIKAVARFQGHQDWGQIQQDAAIGMLGAVQMFDPDMAEPTWANLVRYAFVGARKSALHGLDAETRYLRRNVPTEVIEIEGPLPSTITTVDIERRIRALHSSCGANAKRVLICVLEGSTIRETAERLGFSVSYTRKIYNTLEQLAASLAEVPDGTTT